ncbi:UNVERIFIED_CONTAM: hypothetical protein Slati_3900400 [Sesamum latifolium]|uniref:Uncharacterized protein n=1 Tax=Sesamum latifolium TaxID=2727402 RepID=A0AAW2TLL1_9LAMI
MEKELKRLSKVSADHERALRRAVENAVADYPNSEEGRNFLQAYWAKKVDEYKKSDDFQREVAKVAVPFVGYGFNACKEQFLTHRPLSTSEELSFLVEDDLDGLVGEVEVEVRSPPPITATNSVEGDALSEGKPEGKKENAPSAH